jgi:hypothetical protein
MDVRRRFYVGGGVMVVGAVVCSIPDLTALWVGSIYLAMGLVFILWDYLPDDEEENLDAVAIYFEWLFAEDETETNATMRVFGLVLCVFTGIGYLLSPLIIESWGVWATGLPGSYLIVHSYREWIEEYVLPIPLR